MTRKNLTQFAIFGVLAVVAAGAIGAAQIGGGGGLRPHLIGGPGGERMLEFLADYLDLTVAQKDLAKSTMEATRQANQAAVTQLRAIGEQARIAVQSGKSDAELQQIANSIGPAVSQIAGNHLKAMKALYVTLSQPQKDKLDRLHERMKERMEQRLHPPEQ